MVGIRRAGGSRQPRGATLGKDEARSSPRSAEKEAPGEDVRTVGETCRREAHKAAQCGVARRPPYEGGGGGCDDKVSDRTAGGYRGFDADVKMMAIFGGDASLPMRVSVVDAMAEVATADKMSEIRSGEKGRAEVKEEEEEQEERERRGIMLAFGLPDAVCRFEQRRWTALGETRRRLCLFVPGPG
ncbi:hypothetical protein M440DRAFT_1134017 [Trichoderma longibrachiatum ATCC 18648]|uniref:Uncharacterized protein n=1 Tax=Trichoderma longibrachiatum ATCC 18648 TaxID=983965 RepID=A0A2T4CGS6_TRILO|nr:hypothetical protein M440DRAFT_1134017 [Trichoderma longibrachiatum ATCC 18648]